MNLDRRSVARCARSGRAKRRRSDFPVGLCRLRLAEFLHLDFAGLLADAPKVPVHLHAKPCVGGTPSGLFKPQRHFRRHAAMPVQKIGQRLARHAKPSAASPTVMPVGFKQDSRMTSPGCAGLCIMVRSFPAINGSRSNQGRSHPRRQKRKQAANSTPYSRPGSDDSARRLMLRAHSQLPTC